MLPTKKDALIKKRSIFKDATAIVFLTTVLQIATSVFADDEVTVVIQRVEQLECVDETLWWCGSDGDFYSKVNIDGTQFESSAIGDEADISPNWTFNQMISSRTTNIRIKLWDDDGGLRFGDDHVDVTSSEGRNLDLALDLDSCSISRYCSYCPLCAWLRCLGYCKRCKGQEKPRHY